MIRPNKFIQNGRLMRRGGERPNSASTQSPASPCEGANTQFSKRYKLLSWSQTEFLVPKKAQCRPLVNRFIALLLRKIWKLTLNQGMKVKLALRARAILSVFEKFTRVYLFQIALEIVWLPTQINHVFIYSLFISTALQVTIHRHSGSLDAISKFLQLSSELSLTFTRNWKGELVLEAIALRIRAPVSGMASQKLKDGQTVHVFALRRRQKIFDEVATEMTLSCRKRPGRLLDNLGYCLKNWGKQIRSHPTVLVPDNADGIIESEVDRALFLETLSIMES